MQRHVVHPFQPIVDANCRVLILGSVPSVKTLAFGFPYAHPQNRFWHVMGAYCKCDMLGLDMSQKASVLLANNIALYDAIKECDILGSADSSVVNIVPTDIASLIQGTRIAKVLCNGKLSFDTVTKNNRLDGATVTKMPSTSPANATIKKDKLVELWLSELQANKAL